MGAAWNRVHLLLLLTIVIRVQEDYERTQKTEERHCHTMAVSHLLITSITCADRYQKVLTIPTLTFPLMLVILASSLPPGENLLIDSMLVDLTVSSKPGSFGLLMTRCLYAMLCLYLVVSRLVFST